MADILWHPELPSAADETVRLARDGAPAGTLVLAGVQTAGRGRSGHRWLSAEGGLYLGLVVRPKVPMQCLMALQPLAQLAVLDVLRARGCDRAALGWPNDLLLRSDAAPDDRTADAKVGAVTVDAGVGEGVFGVIGVNLNAGVAPSQDALAEGGDFAATHPQLAGALGWDLGEDDLQALAREVCEAIAARLATYEADVAARRAMAGPLAPFLPELFDEVPLLGKPACAYYADGRVAAEGFLVALDIWDRITVRTQAGADEEYAQEQVTLRAI